MGYESIRKASVSREEYDRLRKARKRQRKLLRRLQEAKRETDKLNRAWLAQNKF